METAPSPPLSPPFGVLLFVHTQKKPLQLFEEAIIYRKHSSLPGSLLKDVEPRVLCPRCHILHTCMPVVHPNHMMLHRCVAVWQQHSCVHVSTNFVLQVHSLIAACCRGLLRCRAGQCGQRSSFASRQTRPGLCHTSRASRGSAAHQVWRQRRQVDAGPNSRPAAAADRLGDQETVQQ